MLHIKRSARKIVLLIASVAILFALFALPSSAYLIIGSSPSLVANQPVYSRFVYDGSSLGSNDVYLFDTQLPDAVPSSIYEYSDDYFSLGNRSTSNGVRFTQGFGAVISDNWNSFTSAEIGVYPFVYRADSSQDTLPDLDILFDARSDIDYQLSYDIRIYSEDGRFIDQYVGGISGSTVVTPPDALPSLSELILQSYNPTYVYYINDYSIKIKAPQGRSFSFAVGYPQIGASYTLSDSPRPNYELLESDDVPAEVTFEEVGFLNIIWNSIKDVFNVPLVGDGYTNGFSLGAILLACIAIPLLIMFLKLILGG